MKIKIRSEGVRLGLWLPNRILKSRWLWRSLKVPIDDVALRVMYREFKKIKKQYRGLELVSVESSDGSVVIIKI